MAGKTLYDKLWDAHLVTEREDGSALIYIDRQIIHEVTSPQAFEGLRLAGRQPWRSGASVATVVVVAAERRRFAIVSEALCPVDLAGADQASCPPV